MPLYFLKTSKILYNNYFKIYDAKGKLIKASFFIVFLLLRSIFSPVPAGYLSTISRGSALGVDRLYDYTIPIICCSIVVLAFYNDYKDNTHELIAFFNYNKFNYIVVIRWLIYVGIFVSGSFITGLLYYRSVSFLDFKNVILSLRFIPNLIFLSSLILLITTSTKDIYAAIFLTLSYFMCDYLSSSHLFKIFSLGANTNNFYYRISPTYYIMNILIILFIGLLNIYISGRVASK